MSKDHTRSLVPYQNILEAWEAEYRETPLADRAAVIDQIMEKISMAATKGKATIADHDILQKVSIQSSPISMDLKLHFVG
jgi:hypothetical protein